MTSEIIKKKEEAKIIVVSTQKGGAGKTDTAFNVAGGLVNNFINEKFAKKICVLDIDPQHTAYEMWESNKNPTFDVIKFDDTGEIPLQNKILELCEFYDYIVIDCPPTAERDINRNNIAKLVNICYRLADLVIIPVPLRKIHVYASIKTQTLLNETINEIIEDRSKLGEKLEIEEVLKVRILINKYKVRSSSTKKWEPILRMGSMFPIFNAFSSDRVSHEKATDGGKSVLDYKGSGRDKIACLEVEELIKEVINTINI